MNSIVTDDLLELVISLDALDSFGCSIQLDFDVAGHALVVAFGFPEQGIDESLERLGLANDRSFIGENPNGKGDKLSLHVHDFLLKIGFIILPVFSARKKKKKV
jgi:hypothetical protein